MSANTLDSYDDLHYESLYPDYLRAIASLYGVKAAPLETCRVLALAQQHADLTSPLS